MSALGWVLGWLWWTVLPVRRNEAVAAYRAAFPDRDPRELRRNVGAVVASYAGLLVGRRAEVVGWELAEGGAIALAGHFAAWDLALLSAARHVPATIAVREPTNRLIARVIRHLRAKEGVELLPPRGSMAALTAALERGRTVVLVQDQRHNDGLDVPFFGRPARTSAAFAALVRRTDRPVVGVWQEWRPDGRLVVRFERLECPPRDAATVDALTAFSQQFYERHIREQPWAWWWLHRRWKRPVTVAPDRGV
jgi:KDO2-lipid IV(A) lauroyltransferase